VKLSKVTLKQPKEQGSLLERNVLMWAVAVQRAVPRIVFSSPEEFAAHTLAVVKGERAGETWLSDAHLLAIGLRQIKEHLQCLKRIRTGFRTPQIRNAAQQFLDAYHRAHVDDLRDLLEHQAEYIVERGETQHLVIDVTESVAFGSDPTEPEESVWVSVFGRKCRVDPIVRAVADLEVALREGSQPRQAAGGATRTVTFELVPGNPPLTFTSTGEAARLILESLLAYPEKSDAQKLAVNLFRQALEQRDTR